MLTLYILMMVHSEKEQFCCYSITKIGHLNSFVKSGISQNILTAYTYASIEITLVEMELLSV